jgi:catechol 2,3-dioxygenase-like lactoylglutathione lyase family enzyme
MVPEAWLRYCRRSSGHRLGGRRNDKGRTIVLLPGDSLEHPDRLQVHFAVPDVDTEYGRLKAAGVQYGPPKDMPWHWRHIYTSDPAGHTVEICSPLREAEDKDSEFV